MTRNEILMQFIGKPWVGNARGPDAYDCWHLVVVVLRQLYERDLPMVVVDLPMTYTGVIRAIDKHAERDNWSEVPTDDMGLVRAKDGAVVLMARRDRPAHIGVWLNPERCVMHSDPKYGVVCDSPLDLKTKGWTRLRFYQPIQEMAECTPH